MKNWLSSTWERSPEMEKILVQVNLATENMMSWIRKNVSKNIGENHQPVSSLNIRNSDIWTEPATFINVNRNALREKLNGEAR